MSWCHCVSEKNHQLSCSNGLVGPQLFIVHVSEQIYTRVDIFCLVAVTDEERGSALLSIIKTLIC